MRKYMCVCLCVWVCVWVYTQRCVSVCAPSIHHLWPIIDELPSSLLASANFLFRLLCPLFFPGGISLGGAETRRSLSVSLSLSHTHTHTHTHSLYHTHMSTLFSGFCEFFNAADSSSMNQDSRHFHLQYNFNDAMNERMNEKRSFAYHRSLNIHSEVHFLTFS